jgi:predicted ATPase
MRPSGRPATPCRRRCHGCAGPLGDAALVTGTSAGYTLEVDANAVDALEVLRLAEQASALRNAGEPSAALDMCSTALAMFRGDILAGAGEGDWLIPHRVRLEEVRLGLLEGQLAARLDLGASGEVIGELEALVSVHPLRETLWALLMVALYREGRQADALAAYARVRCQLADELGLDPGSALQALEQRVLLQDPLLDLGRAAESRSSPRPSGGNVPALSSPMVGRDADLNAVGRLVGQHRLVTLVGAAGVGKTRLAIEVARHADRVAGSWLVRLESARDAGAILQAIAEVLDLPRGTQAMVIDHLRGTEALLVLDNCEQVVDPVAELVTCLLDAAPWLAVLCTSQLPLGLDGEAVYPLEPLAIDDSVHLFTQRAVEHRKSLVLDGAAEKTIEDVCRSLDGLPLAIELAAARAKTLPVEEIARRLNDRFALLSDPTSRRPERQRALGAAIGWSYDLLFPDDQRGLWSLACFSGGAPLAAVEHLLGALEVPTASAVDVVSRLADRSLVAVEVDGDAVRYRLLDSIRAFAFDRLHAAGLADVGLRAHAVWFGDAATSAGEGVRGPSQARHLAFTRTERANIDAALAWAVVHDPALGLRIANGFGWAWFVLGDGPLGTERLRRALTAAEDMARPADRVNSLYITAWLDGSNDVDRAHADAEQALTIAEFIGDKHLHAISRAALAFVLLNQGRPREALGLLEGCPAIHHRLDRRWDEGAAWILTAHAALALSDTTLATRACQNAEACERLGFRATQGFHLVTLGRILQQADDHPGAIAALERAIDIGRATRDMRVVALARVRLARVLRGEGDHEAAKTAVRAADHWFQSSGGGDGAALAACLRAAMDAEDGDTNAATRLRAILEDARRRQDHEIEVLALDALARDCAESRDSSAARGLLETADELMPSVGHLISDADRIDAQHARSLVAAAGTAERPERQ